MLFRLGSELLAAEHGVEPLNGGDDDFGRGVDRVGPEVLDDVEVVEAASVVGRDVVLELAERLVAEVVAVDEEQDAACASIFDQAVDEGAGE
jgi:hypothetical protein